MKSGMNETSVWLQLSQSKAGRSIIGKARKLLLTPMEAMGLSFCSGLMCTDKCLSPMSPWSCMCWLPYRSSYVQLILTNSLDEESERRPTNPYKERIFVVLKNVFSLE